MKYPKLTAVLAAAALLLCGCGTDDGPLPYVEETTTRAETSRTMIPPTEAAYEGFSTADEAYQAYLDACMALDTDAFCALFNENERAEAKNVPQKFMKNHFDLLDNTAYQNFLARLDAEAFRKAISANMSTYQSAMNSFGTAEDSWSIVPGEAEKMSSEEVQQFATALHMEITGGVWRDSFYFQASESGEIVGGDKALLLQIDGSWYPSYTQQCVPMTFNYDDVDVNKSDFQ